MEAEICRYEEAFRNFAVSHDNYLSFEDDDSYQDEQEIKITVENPHKSVEEKGSWYPSF